MNITKKSSYKSVGYRVKPSVYTRKYYLNDSYGGALQYKSGLHELAPSVDYIYRLLPRGKKKQRLLDAGCGKGELLLFAAKLGYVPYGVDYSDTAIKFAKNLMKERKISKAVILKADVRNLSFPTSFFDTVVSTDVVEHLDDNQATIDFLNEAYRVLKPNGKLYIHTAPNKLNLEYFVKYYQRFINFALLNAFYILTGSSKRVTLELRNSYDKIVHVNEQTDKTLRDSLTSSKFHKFRVILFGDPFKFNIYKLPYYIIAYLFPLNRIYPFNRILANHIYAIASK